MYKTHEIVWNVFNADGLHLTTILTNEYDNHIAVKQMLIEEDGYSDDVNVERARII